MISFGIYSYLCTVIAMLMGMLLIRCVLKALDLIFQQTIILCTLGFIFGFAILFASIYIPNTMQIEIILEKGEFEKTSEGSIIKIDNEEIVYLDNETNEINSVYFNEGYDKLKPKIDKTLKPGEIKVSTYTSDWGDYKTAVYNIKQ